MGENEAVGATDRFAEARRRLFPPLRNRKLAQAADALADNRTDIAEALLSRFLEKHPADPHALNLMADIARRAGRFDTAARHLSRCIELEPDCAGYRFNFVVILRRLDKFGEALAQLDELLGKEPRNPLYRDQKAAILRMMGRLDDALVYRRELAQEYPESPQVWLDYGHSLRGSGAQETCIAAYRKALELAPSLAAAYSGLAELKIYHFTAAETARMETLQATSGLSADDRADIHFALGKAYGDQASYARSFDNYAKGNALLRLNVDFDPERLTAHRQNCESLFTRSFFVNRAGWGASSEAPIFIVGMPRSGSTLVEQEFLSSHSAIEGLGELADLDLVVGQWLSGIDDGRPPREFWIGGRLEFRSGLIEALPKVLDRTSANEFRALGEAYLNSTRTRRGLGRPFFTDKGLRNFGYVGLIHLILPHAKIIDVRRHPLDCGWSCFKSQFPGGQPFANRLSDIGRHYANYAGLMSHFDRVLPGRIHRVIYEKLVSDPKGEIGRLLDYLGLPFEEQCLRFHETPRASRTLSSEQVRMPLYQNGMAQWRPYETWLQPLKGALGPLLRETPDGAWCGAMDLLSN